MIGTLRRGEDEKVRANSREAIGGRPKLDEGKPEANLPQVSGEGKPVANSRQVSGEGKPVANSPQVSEQADPRLNSGEGSEQAESLVANSPQVSNSRLNSGEVSFDRRSGA